MRGIPVEQQKSDAILIKEFFELSASEAIKEIKSITPEAKKQLAEGIRNGSLTY
jgi:hypothetical protein